MIRAVAFAGALLGVHSAPASAHHSHAMFFDWANPHCWLYLTATDEAGRQTEWSFELGSPVQIARRGWRPKSVAPGDTVSVTLHPLSEGGPIGSLVSVILPNGTTLGEAQ